MLDISIKHDLIYAYAIVWISLSNIYTIYLCIKDWWKFILLHFSLKRDVMYAIVWISLSIFAYFLVLLLLILIYLEINYIFIKSHDYLKTLFKNISVKKKYISLCWYFVLHLFFCSLYQNFIICLSSNNKNMGAECL